MIEFETCTDNCTGHPCDMCDSKDNIRCFPNGSAHCFTPGCTFHKAPNQDYQEKIDPNLIEGVYSPLSNRRISQRTCEVFGYMTGMYQNMPCHIANIYDDNKRLKAQQIRLPNKDFRMLGDTKDLGLVGKQLWSNKGKSLVITEGYIDMLSIAESQDCRWPVVTVPNGAQSAAKAIKRDLAWLLGFESIVLAFDNDEAGQIATEECVGLFPPGRVKIAKLSEKDANDCLVKGKVKELTNIVFTAAEYRPDGIVWGDDVNFDDLYKEEPRGLVIPLPQLDNKMRGLKPGRIYMLYSGTGCGKTTLMKEIGIHLLKNSTSTAFIMLEESYKYTVKSLIAMDNNIPPWRLEENKNLLSDEQKEAGKKLVKHAGFYNHFGSLASSRLINLMEWLVVAKGVKVIFLDHISLIVSGMASESGEGERKDLDILMTNLRSFAERTQAVIVAATQLKRKKGSYNEGEEITEADSRGSGAIEHISDVIISININRSGNGHPNDAQIKILKNRITGLIGEADLLNYNNDTGRYLPKNNLKSTIVNDKLGEQEDLI